MQTWHSEMLSKKQLSVAIFSGTTFAAVLVFLALRAFFGLNDWMLVGDSVYLNLGLIILFGLVISFGYFMKDYLMYRDSSLTIKHTTLTFKNPKGETSYDIKEMRQIKTFRPIYGWFGVKRMTMQFKSSKDFRRYTHVILIKDEAEVPLSQALKEAKDKTPKKGR